MTAQPGKRILFIDDEAEIVEVVGEMLSGEGYAFEGFTNAQEGLKRAREAPPDLILLDITFPNEEKDGWEVCQELKATPATAKVPLFFVTARDAPVHKMVGLGILKADEYIVKPIRLDDLLSRIDKVFPTSGA